MAEALGAAASIASFVGITGQIVQGISYLSDFFQAFKNASEDIQILLTELAILRQLAERVETHGKQCNALPSSVVSIQAEIEPGLKYCADSVVSLEELVKKYDGKFDKRGGAMRKAGFVFASKQFDKHIGRLERSKGYLIFAQTVLISANQQQHYNLSQSIGLNVENSTQKIASEMANLEVESCKTSAIVTETRDIAKEVLDNSRTLDKVLQSLRQLEDMTALGDLSPMITAAIQKAVAEVLNQQQGDWNQVKRRSRNNIRPMISKDTLTTLQEGVVLDASSKSYENGLTTYTEQSVEDDIDISLAGLQPEVQYLGTRSVIKTQTTWHQTNFWFGTLHVHGSRKTVQKEDADSGDIIKSEESSQTDVRFIPASWIFRKGAIATMTWVTKSFQKPTFSMGLQVFNVVPRESLIIKACESSDLATIRQLFDSGMASPLDRDADGYILTDWAIYPMIERLATWEKPWIKELRSCFGVCRFLIDHCGLDPSQSQSHKWAVSNKRTAWTTLLMFQIRNRGYKDTAAAAPWFERILRLLICRAKTNPFAQAKDSLADVLELQARHLDDTIVDSAFNILAGQETWSIEWDEGLGAHAAHTPTVAGHVYHPSAIGFIQYRMIPATIKASEAAARGHLDIDSLRESFSRWSVMFEKVLEDVSRVNERDFCGLMVAIFDPLHGFIGLNPSEDVLNIFKASIKSMILIIMQYGQKRKILDATVNTEFPVLGYGTWKMNKTSDVWKRVEENFFIENKERPLTYTRFAGSYG